VLELAKNTTRDDRKLPLCSSARLLVVPPRRGKGLEAVGDANTVGSLDLDGATLPLWIFRMWHHGGLLRNMVCNFSSIDVL
jgi:hypothetical protein